MNKQKFLDKLEDFKWYVQVKAAKVNLKIAEWYEKLRDKLDIFKNVR